MAFIYCKEWCPLNVPIIKIFIPTSLSRLLPIGLYNLTFRLMGALLVINLISVRRYFLTVENLLPLCKRLTYLPYFSVSYIIGVVSIMTSSNFSFCYFRTFILWNYFYRHYDNHFPIIDQTSSGWCYNSVELIEVLYKCSYTYTN